MDKEVKGAFVLENPSTILNFEKIKLDRALETKQVWYDWMMQYYASTIITYYRLKKEHEFDY